MIDHTLYPPPRLSWKKVAAKLSPEKQNELLAPFQEHEAGLLDFDFFLNARREQLAPPGDWSIWIILAGRGFGKNYSGSNWLIDKHLSGLARNSGIVAATSSDLRRYCIEGPSGILAQAPSYFRPRDVPSKSRLEWPNGTVTHYFTSEKPNRLRGPNLDYAWCDELTYWKYVQDTWNMLSFALRLGKRPQRIITMTPRPIKLLRDLLKREGKDVVVTRGSTYDNIDNLAEDFVREIKDTYEGTRLGRQEIGGELLNEAEGALWNHDMIGELRQDTDPKLIRIVVGVDPSTTSGENADEAGIVVAGKDKDGIGYVLGDHSFRGSPNSWASKAIECYHQYGANCIIAEKNQGGEMISTIIHNIDKHVPVKLVHASVGKVARAEPVAVQYERGKVKHCRVFRELEDEMCNFVPGDITESPNRVDAMVWAMTDLVVKPMLKAGTWGRRREKELKDKRGHVTPAAARVRKRTYKLRIMR